MNVAFYLRRSTTDLQPESLEAQREILNRWASEHGHEVVATYEDSASGRSIEGRDEFLRMIETVKAGAPFSVIAVRDVSRWSRAANLDIAGFYEFICRSNGVAVVYVEESFDDDSSPYTLMLKQLKRAMAAEFSLERERMVHASHARVVRQGFWPLGSVPYGLKRVLVENDGTVIKDMLPGDRKALSTQRIKLAPGSQDQVKTVRRIFHEYVTGKLSVRSIADLLNAERIPSSKGSVWTPAMISYVLQNESYVGNLVYQIRRQRKRSVLFNLGESSEAEITRCEGAHEAIVERSTWKSAQERLSSNRLRKTDDDLLGELKSRIRLWCPTAKRIVLPPVHFLRKGYGGPDTVIVAKALKAALVRLRDQLEKNFHVDEFEGGFLLDHLLHVGVTSSLPHARFGRLHWLFAFDGINACDVALGLAFSPPPRIEHVESFLFRMSRARGHKTVRPPLDSSGSHRKAYSRFSHVDSLADALRHQISHRGKRAETVFLNRVRQEDKLSLRHVADDLGWPLPVTRSMYRRLDLRGETMPPLRGGTRVGRITVTCPHCLRDRLLAPSTLLRLQTEVCFDCLHRPVVKTRNRHVAICPACGEKRLLTDSELKARSNGTETLCLRCSRLRNVGQLPKKEDSCE
jgi:DNA invertase Pin-like site-specific DNA recombinase